ncbi:MAG: hypothetical protein LBK53_04760 [Heliobacteriaceae bacterium]|jgi:hypothetical protein|nr:hypothetical protein [Heliobacteriaceae bacterium]
MNISNEIRKLLIDKDYTLTELAGIISQKKNKNFSVQNLSQKLKNNTITLKEFEIILDVLGYSISFQHK